MNNSMCEFRLVASKDEINKTVILAKEIWNQHYVQIIGQDQVDYMLDKFQSESAIDTQIKQEGYQYYQVYHQRILVGYFSFKLKGTELFLSKIYLTLNQRGKGLGKEMLQFIISKAVELGCEKVRLTVNKYNSKSIEAYERSGFTKIDSVVMDIGGGYVMDDFVMEKSVV